MFGSCNSDSASVPSDTPLDDVIGSPNLLANALIRRLGKNQAMELLQGALDECAADFGEPPPEDLATTTRIAFAPGVDKSHESHKDVEATNTEMSVFAEDDVSKEQLQIMKARTMYNMVEDLAEGKGKILFLTNPQAELISSTPESIQKMLDALEITKPSLVIEMLQSWGFKGSTIFMNGEEARPEYAGLDRNRASFLSREEEAAAEMKIDMFMADVIIPLAAQTNAIVICNAVLGNDMLSTSFLRMYSVAKTQWVGRPPFTILSTTNGIGT